MIVAGKKRKLRNLIAASICVLQADYQSYFTVSILAYHNQPFSSYDIISFKKKTQTKETVIPKLQSRQMAPPGYPQIFSATHPLLRE